MAATGLQDKKRKRNKKADEASARIGEYYPGDHQNRAAAEENFARETSRAEHERDRDWNNCYQKQRHIIRVTEDAAAPAAGAIAFDGHQSEAIVVDCSQAQPNAGNKREQQQSL